jgi:hypothetical protein
VLGDVLSAARCESHTKVADERAEPTFGIEGMDVLPKPPKADAEA